MNRKFVFLDIDGTLIDDGEVLHKSTAEAIEKAAKNGHKLFLCSGRERNIVSKKLVEAGLSDGVFGAGASVICEGKEIFHSSFSTEVYDRMIDVLTKYDSVITLETFSEEIFLESTMRKGFEHFREWLEELGSVFVQDIPKGLDNVDKVVFFAAGVPVSRIAEEIGGECNIVTMSYQSGGNGGEIMQTGITKATGIQKVLDFYDGDLSDTIGIGDGANDIEMLKLCNTGIAMGNADPRAKAAADIITDHIGDDGLYKAFEMMKLI